MDNFKVGDVVYVKDDVSGIEFIAIISEIDIENSLMYPYRLHPTSIITGNKKELYLTSSSDRNNKYIVARDSELRIASILEMILYL